MAVAMSCMGYGTWSGKAGLQGLLRLDAGTQTGRLYSCVARARLAHPHTLCKREVPAQGLSRGLGWDGRGGAMLTTADAVRILGPECGLTDNQIAVLLEQIHLLARFVFDDLISESQPCNDRGDDV